MVKLGKQQNKFWLTVGLCTLGAAFIFLPFYIVDKGIFLYCGDFNSQYIPFNYYANQFIKEGGTWSWATDLGSGFVNSYSYYLLGSPFFWPMLLLPASWQPFLMAPMLCVKYGVAGGGAYLWLRRYARQGNMAVVGACLYAFSGFMVYNTFFFSFLDGVALFPYMLWALDEAVYERRRGLFCALVALNLVNNYFFFAGQIVFLFLYFGCKCLAREWRLTKKLFGTLAFESLLGCGMGCVLAWPALLSLSQNPRTVNLSSGFGFLLYGKVQQYFAIFASLFFPPDPPYLPNMFTDCIIRHTSMTAYLPLIGAAGVIAYLRSRKGTAFRRVLLACLFCAFVPVLNSAFYALNASYYARWYYMPVLVMCGATVLALEAPDIDVGRLGAKPAALICLAFTVFALVPKKSDEGEWSLGVVQYQSQFWLMVGLALLGLMVFWLLWLKYRGTVRLAPALLAAVLSFSCLYSVFHFSIGKFPQWEGDGKWRQQCYVEGRELAASLPEGFYRVDTYGCYDNLDLWLGKSGLQFFSTTVEPSIMEFYPLVDVTRDVSSKPELSNYALRGLLSVKYLLCPTDKQEEFEGKMGESWQLYGTQGSYAIYENKNWLPMGFTYDSYITQKDFEAAPKSTRSNLLLKAMVLSEEQIGQYGALLGELPESERDERTYDAYVQDVQARRQTAATSFEADNYGFTARIRLPQDDLVFFSVPWSEGFTATVNGQPAPVEKVSNGMMAIPAPEGECEIRVDYHTPGLGQSTAVAVLSLVVYAVYLGVLWAGKKKKTA